MNADETQMNAEKIEAIRDKFARRSKVMRSLCLSAFIFTSAFICVSSLLSQSAAADFFSGETLKAERREAISP